MIDEQWRGPRRGIVESFGLNTGTVSGGFDSDLPGESSEEEVRRAREMRKFIASLDKDSLLTLLELAEEFLTDKIDGPVGQAPVDNLNEALIGVTADLQDRIKAGEKDLEDTLQIIRDLHLKLFEFEDCDLFGAKFPSLRELINLAETTAKPT